MTPFTSYITWLSTDETKKESTNYILCYNLRDVPIIYLYLYFTLWQVQEGKKDKALRSNILCIYIYYNFISSVKCSLMLQNFQIVWFSMQVSFEFKVLVFCLLKHDLVWS